MIVETPTFACQTCEDTRYVQVPVCHGGSDHGGRNCHGWVCGYEEDNCPDCNPRYERDRRDD